MQTRLSCLGRKYSWLCMKMYYCTRRVMTYNNKHIFTVIDKTMLKYYYHYLTIELQHNYIKVTSNISQL